jgi:hypothetical protein
MEEGGWRKDDIMGEFFFRFWSKKEERIYRNKLSA